MANDNTNKGTGMPTFAPPSGPPQFSAPTFQAPQYNGPVCFHHNTERAVARCARCGKNICKDCAEAYTVSAGDYEGKCLCFDCCEQLVASNIEELTQNKATIKGQFVLQIVGMVVGAIFGLAYALDGGGMPGMVY